MLQVQTNKIYDEYEKQKAQITSGWSHDDERWQSEYLDYLENKKDGKLFISEILKFFEIEYKQFVEQNKFFTGCPFNIYNKHYEDRLNKFLTENNNNQYKEHHFVKEELNKLINFSPDYFLENENIKKLNKAIYRTQDFLFERLVSIGYEYEIKNEKYGFRSITLKMNPSNINSPKNLENIDLSDSNIPDKIRYLKLTGVYDFLKNQEPFNTSSNKLASLLSAILGEKANSIQPLINPIDNEGVIQTKNPLKNDKKVNIIKNKLRDLGCNID